MSLQPTEFLKPCFAVVAAWLLQRGPAHAALPGNADRRRRVFGLIALLLKSQPDLGMLAVVTARVLRAALRRRAQPGAGRRRASSRCGFGGDRRLHAVPACAQPRSTASSIPDTGDHYQVTTALEAFGNGGLLGPRSRRGPRQGRAARRACRFRLRRRRRGVRHHRLPRHPGLFAFIVLRGLLRLLQEHDLFVVLAATGPRRPASACRRSSTWPPRCT